MVCRDSRPCRSEIRRYLILTAPLTTSRFSNPCKEDSTVASSMYRSPSMAVKMDKGDRSVSGKTSSSSRRYRSPTISVQSLLFSSSTNSISSSSLVMIRSPIGHESAMVEPLEHSSSSKMQRGERRQRVIMAQSVVKEHININYLQVMVCKREVFESEFSSIPRSNGGEN